MGKLAFSLVGLSILTLLLGSSSPLAATATPTVATTTTFSVSSNIGWQDTGLDVVAGDLLEITASSSIRFDSAGRMADPDGQPDGDAVPCSNGLVPAVFCHTLVGRIGSSGSLADLSGFLVGSSFSQITTGSGRLFLGFNDGFVKTDRSGLDSGGVGDNSGSYTAQIGIGMVPLGMPGFGPLGLTFLLLVFGALVIRRNAKAVYAA